MMCLVLSWTLFVPPLCHKQNWNFMLYYFLLFKTPVPPVATSNFSQACCWWSPTCCLVAFGRPFSDNPVAIVFGSPTSFGCYTCFFGGRIVLGMQNVGRCSWLLMLSHINWIESCLGSSRFALGECRCRPVLHYFLIHLYHWIVSFFSMNGLDWETVRRWKPDVKNVTIHLFGNGRSSEPNLQLFGVPCSFSGVYPRMLFHVLKVYFEVIHRWVCFLWIIQTSLTILIRNPSQWMKNNTGPSTIPASWKSPSFSRSKPTVDRRMFFQLAAMLLFPEGLHLKW